MDTRKALYQFVFWMVLCVLFLVLSAWHCSMVGQHLLPVEEFDMRSGAVISEGGGPGVDLWEPISNAIIATNQRIASMNANNDRVNTMTAISYAVTSLAAFFSGIFPVITAPRQIRTGSLRRPKRWIRQATPRLRNRPVNAVRGHPHRARRVHY